MGVVNWDAAVKVVVKKVSEMSITDRRQGAELAGTLLRCSTEEAYQNSSDVPEIDAFFYWQPVRGGARLLVAHDGSVLFGASSLTTEQLIAFFASGKRTEFWKFEAE